MIKVGFARVDITPEKFGPMAGFGNDTRRITTNIFDRIFGTCIAISDEEGSTVLLYTLDLAGVSAVRAQTYRQAITSATGIPGDRIMVAGTHTHSGPSINGDSPIVDDYHDDIAQRLAKAAKEALGDLAPATIQVGSGIGERMCFDRHYLNHDSQFIGSGYGHPRESIASHVAEPDWQIQLIRFVREYARDVLLMNFQAHVTFVGGPEDDTNLSADYVGVCRDQVEGKTGCRVAFFQGACGNLVPNSNIPGENRYQPTLNPRLRYIPYGKILADEVMKIIDTLYPVQTGPVRTKQVQYAAPVDHTEDHRLEEANLYWDQYYEWTPETRREYTKKFGFKGRLHAGAIRNRARLGTTENLELNAITVGDLGFATVPYEMFCSNGKFIKENSPCKMTFVLGYCNGMFAYLADRQLFQYGDDAYEVYNRRYPEGTAENIAETHVKMLQELK